MIDMIMYGKAPMLISGVQKSAPSLAITRSHESASPSPPATTWPLAAHSDGLPSRGISRKNSRKRSVPKCFWIAGASEPKPPRSAPAQNALPAPVSTSARASSSSRTRRDRLDELREHLPREPVALLGVVQGDGRDTVFDCVEDELLGHRRPP